MLKLRLFDSPPAHEEILKESEGVVCHAVDRILLVDDLLVKERINVDCKNTPGVFYGVSLPASIHVEEEGKLWVFEDKSEALQAVKKHKGSRFKAFSRREDAVVFASQHPEANCLLSPAGDSPGGMVATGEKPSVFKAPRSQDVVRLRKAIEGGDAVQFKATVWDNPRYLIGSGDTPTIMQEGFRYNGLHVAARFKQAGMCRLILDTVQDPAFMALLYADDSEAVRTQRIRFITDLYLNTPDKGLCETPLHFASKFGCLQVVEILASHPVCDKTRKNKYGLQAMEIICERCPSSGPELKRQIEEAFGGRFYVPVLRSEDGAYQPVIGEPCSPEDLRSPEGLSVMAAAGPMSPDQANSFYRCWKTPKSSRLGGSKLKDLRTIRLCDTEKGLERIGRDLAKQMNTKWVEYWPILDAWCDLASSEGMEKLESHLRKLYSEMMAMPKCVEVEEVEPSTPLSADESSGISRLCRQLEDFHFSDSDDVASPLADRHPMHCSTPVSGDTPVFCCSGDPGKRDAPLVKCLRDAGLKNGRVHALLGDAHGDVTEALLAELSGPEVGAAIAEVEKYLDGGESTEELRCVLRLLCERGCREEEEDEFVTPPGSPARSDSEEEEEAVTPEEGLEVYVQGRVPSKLDVDMLRALQNVDVDPIRYPHVCRWRHLVQCKGPDTIERWPSPRGAARTATPRQNRAAAPLRRSLF